MAGINEKMVKTFNGMASLKISYFTLLLICFSMAVTGQNQPKREMRGVWIASVSNIDWPSKPGLPTGQQQAELIRLLDLACEYHLNTVVLQVRPATDAFYPSPYEPWSQWLTGKQGEAPNPFYDPLAFAIEACRSRGLSIHLWLNPYRAEMDTTRGALVERHPGRINPDWFVVYGKSRYFNPGMQETRNHVSRVVADLVRRYDMDAIHMDDYFYPYRIAGVEFPDEQAFKRSPNGFQPDQKDAWRRDNVDRIIRQIHDSIKSIKPQVEFGISPFGVWRNSHVDPRGSKTRAGVTNYDDLYADVLKWQKEGWIDYVAPQLYWHIGMEAADYAILADWWSRNTFGCPLYIGHSWYRLDPQSKTESWQSSEEIIRQIQLNRKYETIGGSMFFSANNLIKNPLNLKENLLKHAYPYFSIPPINQRIEPIVPDAPKHAKITNDRKTITLEWESGANNQSFVLYKLGKRKRGVDLDNPEHIIFITGHNSVEIEWSKHTNPNRYKYLVTALSKTNHESAGTLFEKE
jgi:uncharacterized lipoprotein YddW (UPF0748 family)